MEIDYINGPRTEKVFGISKYQTEIFRRIESVEWNIIEYDSFMQILEKKYNESSKSGSHSQATGNRSVYKSKALKFVEDIGKKTVKTLDKCRYIHTVKNEVKEGNIKHITSQELAYVLNSVKLENTIVTCYDLIPWVYDKDRSSILKENMKGLRCADCIITISEFSKAEIVRVLNYPEERIEIVYPAVDHSVYYEKRDEKILGKLNISNEEKVVLYVGSEMPRQNVPVLIKAFAELKKKFPEIKLVKIGESQNHRAHENILKLINDLHLQDDVIFAGYVPEEDMPRWYNASDVLVYPCAYAGFGLPPLEAMACGTPVITSNTTSLPEVVGDAGIMINPQDVDLIADKMYEILTNENLWEELSRKGIKQSKQFTWENSAKKTLKIYEMMI